MITGDFHTHGSLSHGHGSAMENARVAHEKGLKSIAITEHGMNILVGGLREREFALFKKEIAEAQAAYPDVRIYYGIEADIISPDGEIDIPERFKDEFEIVLLGMHYFVWGSKFMNVQRIVWRNFFRRFIKNRSKLRKINTVALVNAVHRYRIDALSHLGTSMPDFDIVRVAKACEETDTCIEINNKHCSLSEEQLKYLATTNCKYLVGSDAHEPEKVGDVDEMLSKALNAGIDIKNILNAGGTYIPKRLRT